MSNESELVILCGKLQELFPGTRAGFDLRLSAGPPEDDPIVIDVFSLPEDKEIEFSRRSLPLIRDAEKRLGKAVLVITHDPEATRQHYFNVVQRLETVSRAAKVSEQPLASQVLELTMTTLVNELLRQS